MSQFATSSEIDADKAAFNESIERFLRVFDSTRDDRVNWTPSPTSRTPNQIAAHTAMALESILHMAQGIPFPVEDVEEADRGFRIWEMQFTDRGQIVNMINDRAQAIARFIESCSDEELDEMMTLPFRLGAAPKRFALKFAKMHTDSHTPQIEYIQTCYGDLDWRMPT